MRNVEMKLSLPSDTTLDDVSKRCCKASVLAAQFQQYDIFFNVTQPGTRLKLRHNINQMGNGPDVEQYELISYSRPDVAGPKLSVYNKCNLSAEDGPRMKAVLTQALGVKGQVKKRRSVYIWGGQTRIHLDSVEGLGDFLELEVVLDEDQSEVDGESVAKSILTSLFGTTEKGHHVSCAYIDLILHGQQNTTHE